MAVRTSGKSISQSRPRASGGKAGAPAAFGGAPKVNGRPNLGERNAGGGTVRVFGRGIKEPISTRGSGQKAAVPSGAASRTAPIPK